MHSACIAWPWIAPGPLFFGCAGRREGERGQGLLKLLAAVAPLLGLLGTVTGMIITFQAITQSGGGDSRLMADGISQALVTTVEGLVVAIPLLFLHSVLSARSKGVVQLLEQQCVGLLALHMSGYKRSE